jgi:HK97 family phage prohead protease
MSGERLELREAGNGTVTIAGYASVTERPYDMSFYTETIARHAFRRSLNNSPTVVYLVDHGGLPLASTQTGTLRLSEDSHGLFSEADMAADDPDAVALVSKVRRGLVTEQSFAFRAVQQEWSADHSERRIIAAELNRGDVSAVSYGANDATSLALRAAGALPPEERARRAQLIGDRISGAVILRAAGDGGDACARCGGAGTVTIPCPTCTTSAGARDAPAPIKRGAAETALRARLEQHLRNGSPARSTGRVASLSATELRLRVRAMQERERVRRER